MEQILDFLLGTVWGYIIIGIVGALAFVCLSANDLFSEASRRQDKACLGKAHTPETHSA